MAHRDTMRVWYVTVIPPYVPTVEGNPTAIERWITAGSVTRIRRTIVLWTAHRPGEVVYGLTSVGSVEVPTAAWTALLCRMETAGSTCVACATLTPRTIADRTAEWFGVAIALLICVEYVAAAIAHAQTALLCIMVLTVKINVVPATTATRMTAFRTARVKSPKFRKAIELPIFSPTCVYLLRAA